MLKVIAGEDRFKILARPSQVFDRNHKPSGFCVLEVNGEDKPLGWLKAVASFSLDGTTLVRCQEFAAPKFKTVQEAQDFLSRSEVFEAPNQNISLHFG